MTPGESGERGGEVEPNKAWAPIKSLYSCHAILSLPVLRTTSNRRRRRPRISMHRSMDEETIKTPIPKYVVFTGVFVWGVVAILF